MAFLLNNHFSTARVSKADEHDNMQTIKPTRSPLASPPEALPARSFSSMGRRNNDSNDFEYGEESSEGYSDLAPDDERELSVKIEKFKANGLKSHRIYRPEDISKLSLVGSTLGPSHPTAGRRTSGDSPSRPRLPSSSSFGSGSSPSHSRAASFRFITSEEEANQIRATENELKKYAETQDEEGYDDVFGISKDANVGYSSPDLFKLGTRRSNGSWREGVEDDEDFDPFADIEDSYSAIDTEANLLRDKHSMLCATVHDMIERLQASSGEELLKSSTLQLLSVLEGAGDLQDYFIHAHGMLAVLEVLEAAPHRDVVYNLLKLVNLMIATDPAVLENLCLIGAIPILKTFTGRRYSLAIRLEAATFVGSLTSSALTLQMFISCRGLRVLVELLDEDYSANRDLVLSALQGVSSVFELQTPTPKNDFCRMFIREGIVDPLGTVLLHVFKDDSEDVHAFKSQIAGIILMFCQTAQADKRIQESLGTRSFVKRELRSNVIPISMRLFAEQ